MESSPTSDDVKTVQLLAKGILELYEPPLTTINTHLKELTEKQEAVQGMITSERRKLEDLQNDADLDALMADMATNRERLASMSTTMMNLHKRVQALSYGDSMSVSIGRMRTHVSPYKNGLKIRKTKLRLEIRAANVEKVARSKTAQMKSPNV